jgi:hypothetical protein
LFATGSLSERRFSSSTGSQTSGDSTGLMGDSPYSRALQGSSDFTGW